MTKWKAGLVHFAISVPIIAAAALAMTVAWYPPPFFQASGGGHLILILACVDVVIGPFLTLLVYRHGKRTLRFDLTVIAMIQTAALLYGAYTIFLARPAYVVFVVNQFEVVTAADIPAEEQIQAIAPQFKYSPIGRFRLAVARIPESVDEQQRILFAAFVGHDLSHFPQHFVDYERQGTEVAARAQRLSVLKKLNPGREGQISEWANGFGMQESHLGYIPVRAVKRDFAALIDTRSGRVLDFAAFVPW